MELTTQQLIAQLQAYDPSGTKHVVLVLQGDEFDTQGTLTGVEVDDDGQAIVLSASQEIL
jgi:hypothetical protein